jgi:aminocarboxymuconate-semialdehyde decarboxylase
VLSTVPVMFSYWAKPRDTVVVSRFLNDHIAGLCKKNPTRFVGLGTLPMQAPELAVTELERCMTELGLCGVQIGSHINDMALSDPRLFPIFEACERLGVTLM